MSRQSIVWLFLALAALYVTLYYNVPPNQEVMERYDLSSSSLTLLRSSILVPLMVIWLVALYGFVRLFQYASTIHGSPESGPIHLVASGLLILAFGFPLSGIANTVATLQIENNPAWEPAATILSNYFKIIFPLVAFLYIKRGAEALSKTIRMTSPERHTMLFMLGFILLASVYTALLIAAPFSNASIQEIYFMPTWLVVVTIITPYLFTWYNGIAAAYLLIRYRRKVRGLIYKSSFGQLATGLIVITVTAIIIRFLTTINEQLTQLDISPLLMIVYGLVILYGIGYGLVASGANKLTKLEKV